MKNVIRSVADDVPFHTAQLRNLFLVFKVKHSISHFTCQKSQLCQIVMLTTWSMIFMAKFKLLQNYRKPCFYIIAAATITVVCSRNEDENAKVGVRL